MKLLLIGFSTQSAGVLSMLINRNYPDCQVVVIERAFSKSLRLCLPVLEAKHQDAAAMIINLDGVGMIGYSVKHIKVLQEFIGVRAAVFTTKAVLIEWRAARILPKDFAIFVRSPYDKQTMSSALDSLFTIAPAAKVRINDFHRTDLLSQAILDNEMHSQQSKNDIQKNREHALHAIIDRHFNLKQREILHDMFSIALAETPIKITIGSQTLYANHAKNLALAANRERIMDYCAVISNFQVFSNVLTIKPISEEYFNELLILSPGNSLQKLALSTLLWQMYSKILPNDMPIEDHSLQLRMRYMPNFSQIQNVPDRVRSLLSSALVTPKTVDELYLASGNQVPKAVLHRIFLLAVLSGIADNDILQQSFDNELIESRKPEEKNSFIQAKQNQGVVRAKSSGFLGRLMKVLNADVGEILTKDVGELISGR